MMLTHGSSSLVAGFTLFVLSLAGPVPLDSRQFSNDQLAQLSNDYRGVYWDEAKDTCSDAQFAILAQATRVMYKFTNQQDQYYFQDSPGFNSFFVSPINTLSGSGWRDTTANNNAYYTIKSNFEQVHDFPVKGKKQNSPKQRVHYTCKQPSTRSHICATGVGAFAAPPTIADSGAWTITFCPAFFDLPYLDALSSKPSVPRAQLGKLYSYEHVLAHEWMHCNVAGMKGLGAPDPDALVGSFITDVRATLPGYPNDVNGEELIYGAQKCRDFAWINAKGGKHPTPNRETAINADSYAWALTNNWFDQTYHWNEHVNTDIGFWNDPLGKNKQKRADYHVAAGFDPTPADAPTLDLPEFIQDGSKLDDTAFTTVTNCRTDSNAGILAPKGDPETCSYLF